MSFSLHDLDIGYIQIYVAPNDHRMDYLIAIYPRYSRTGSFIGSIKPTETRLFWPSNSPITLIDLIVLEGLRQKIELKELLFQYGTTGNGTVIQYRTELRYTLSV
jgi:hypothetical protein